MFKIFSTLFSPLEVFLGRYPYVTVQLCLYAEVSTVGKDTSPTSGLMQPFYKCSLVWSSLFLCVVFQLRLCRKMWLPFLLCCGSLFSWTWHRPGTSYCWGQWVFLYTFIACSILHIVEDMIFMKGSYLAESSMTLSTGCPTWTIRRILETCRYTPLLSLFAVFSHVTAHVVKHQLEIWSPVCMAECSPGEIRVLLYPHPVARTRFLIYM